MLTGVWIQAHYTVLSRTGQQHTSKSARTRNPSRPCPPPRLPFYVSPCLFVCACLRFQIFSAANGGEGSCELDRNSGTSMSCPIAAGAAALVRQYFVDGFYSDDVEARSGLCASGANPAWACSSFSPSGALVKVRDSAFILVRDLSFDEIGGGAVWKRKAGR